MRWLIIETQSEWKEELETHYHSMIYDYPCVDTTGMTIMEVVEQVCELINPNCRGWEIEVLGEN